MQFLSTETKICLLKGKAQKTTPKAKWSKAFPNKQAIHKRGNTAANKHVNSSNQRSANLNSYAFVIANWQKLNPSLFKSNFLKREKALSKNKKTHTHLTTLRKGEHSYNIE